MPEHFDDFPVLAGLGTSLRAAMADAEAAEATAAVPGAATPVDAAPVRDRHTRRWRRGPRSFGALSSILVLGVVGTAAAAATLTVLRGSPIPAPRAADLQPAMTAKAETQRVLDLRAADPSGGGIPPYALRIGESQGGLTCVTVGQVDGDQFGIVGTDRRFRKLPPTLIDGCGQETGSGPAVAGARILEARRYDDVRSIVYGVAGPSLRRATLDVRGTTQEVPVSDGAFLTALKGYPDDNGLVLHLVFADGHRTTHPLGKGLLTVVDPNGPAWKLLGGGLETGNRTQRSCVSLSRARETPRTPRTAQVCDETRGPKSGIARHELFFDIRTFKRGDRGRISRRYPGEWRWYDAPKRTIVWGGADPKRVKSVTARAADGTVATAVPMYWGFAIVFDGRVPARGMRVTADFTDGRRKTFDRPLLPVGRTIP